MPLCDAITRKGKPCPHTYQVGFPQHLAGHNVFDKNYFYVGGRQIHLCDGHWESLKARKKEKRAVQLSDGGWLHCLDGYNFTGVIVTISKRHPTISDCYLLPEKWGATIVKGNVPLDVIEKLKIPPELLEKASKGLI